MMAAYRWTHSPSQLVWSEGWQLLGAKSAYSSNELSQWPCHDNSTINIGIMIIIIIIMMKIITIGHTDLR